MRVVVYSCLFGNYRNDISPFNSLSKDNLDPKNDYYFFTDNNDIVKEGWNIIYMPLIPSNNTIITSARLTSKYIKFITPKILESYDILIWIDCKQVSNKIIYKNIIDLLEKYPEYDIFNLQHPVRKTIQEELEITIRTKVENKEYGTEFLKKILEFKSPFVLPETCIIIRKNTSSTNDVFEHCYALINTYKLQRDQNIYNYACYEKNIIPLILPTIPILLNNTQSYSKNLLPNNCASTT